MWFPTGFVRNSKIDVMNGIVLVGTATATTTTTTITTIFSHW